ncbi:MAG: hypothetical protein ACOYXM_03825 [Actinomycetota bacterium]
MRRRHEPGTDPSPRPPADDGGPTTGYDWTRFGRHRLRTPAAVVIDHPLDPAGWAATVWADPTEPGGWTRLSWEPTHTVGGWALPPRLALGDLVEFGTHTRPEARWYGIVDSYEPDGWLTLQGPYPLPDAAAQDATRLLAAERYLPPLNADPHHGAATPCTRGRRQHRRP